MYLGMQQERKRHEWSQAYVAQQIGVTPETVHYIETGQRKPSYDVLVKLEDLFQLGHRELFRIATPDNQSKTLNLIIPRKKERKKMHVGENIRRIREEKGIAQVKLAEEAGITQAMLCQVERGSKNPSLQVGREIALCLGCTIEDLFREE